MKIVLNGFFFFLSLFCFGGILVGADSKESALPGTEILPNESMGYQNETFWQRELQTPWQPVPTDPIRNAILTEARTRRRSWPKAPQADDATLESAGIRKYTGRYVTFHTDMPASDVIDGYVNVFDNALPILCEHFGLETIDHDLWHVDAYLMKTKVPFEKVGVLKGVPSFTSGYSLDDRIFALDQGYDYYNRFLLVHELVHTFMNEDFGSLRPRWYSEGMAEYWGLHRIEGEKLSLGIIPDSLEEVPGFNRMGTLREQVKQRKNPTLERILNYRPADYRTTDTYAWSWALVMFLDRHARYRDISNRMPYYMMAPNPNERFLSLLKKDNLPLAADWSDFMMNFDYGYDFERTAIEYQAGSPLSESEAQTGKIVEVSAQKGWISSGILLEEGKAYQIRGAGQFELYDSRQMVPSESAGVTYQYVNGFPRGTLLVSILPEHNGTDLTIQPWQDILPAATTRIFHPSKTGTLYLRINDTAKYLKENKGSLKVRIREIPATKTDS